MDFKNWYVVAVDIQKEKSAKSQLLARQKVFADTFLEEVEYLERKELRVLKGGKRKVQTRLLMPGYMLVKVKQQVIENEDGSKETIFPPDTFDLITQTPGIKFFVNCDNLNPIPTRPREVKRMFDMCDDAHLEVKQNVDSDFQEGDILEVVSGPFAGYKCEVISIQGQKILGQLDMFGRSIPAEFSFDQVYKK
jgi:transcriptional antiterminator NusG